jgi:hypothetical protein
MRARIFVIGLVVGVLLSSAAIVLAGNLDPPSGPTDAASQMWTLEQIYQRLDTGAAGTKMTGFTEPASGPGTGTMHTLDDIMGIAPAADNTNGAVPGDVLQGTSYWGLRTDGTWGPQTGTAPPVPVPRTGQTVSRGDRDDGELETGVDWPEPRFTIHDMGTPQVADDTVTDNLTGLMWTRNADHGSMRWKDGSDYPALEYCNSLEVGVYGDWRLPNIRELHSLIHYGVCGPAVPNTAGTAKWSEGHPFTGLDPAPYYWSSTTDENDPEEAWQVNMFNGEVYDEKKDTDHYVWPVRGGQ